MRKLLLILFFFACSYGNESVAQGLYFPPLNSNAFWDTLSPSSLGWCLNEIDSLYDYLAQQDTKGFIVLKDGKIVLEKYFGTFTKDSLWYWASAGKTITSFLTGKAQEENFLLLSDPSSNYLGQGWTSCTPSQENNITIRHQLTMSSGLDDGVPDSDCTLSSCLNYLADPGTRWAYHNAPYTLLESVLSAASGVSLNSYTQSRLKVKTGMTGSWFSVGYNNVFFSQVRSMARFGLLIQNNCIWNGDTLLNDTSYIQQMTQTSQNMNLSYGYLWWLNGKPSYMFPGSQLVVPGAYAPAAPLDMFAGLGKNGQIVSVSRSTGLVVVRMGNEAGGGQVPTLLCNTIWEKLNAAICLPTSIKNQPSAEFSFSPNPVSDILDIHTYNSEPFSFQIFNSAGYPVMSGSHQTKVDVSTLASGLYLLCIRQGDQFSVKKFIRMN
jgi:CubicO group peptidase (beta-lactamase class C family)